MSRIENLYKRKKKYPHQLTREEELEIDIYELRMKGPKVNPSWEDDRKMYTKPKEDKLQVKPKDDKVYVIYESNVTNPTWHQAFVGSYEEVNEYKDKHKYSKFKTGIVHGGRNE